MNATLNSTGLNSTIETRRDELTAQAIMISTAAHEMALTADLFSARIRTPRYRVDDRSRIEAHLAQVRRNCAEAQQRADDAQLDLRNPDLDPKEAAILDEQLRDARVHLTLADYAFDRAYEAEL